MDPDKFKPDPHQTVQFTADPDPAPHQSDAKLRLLVYGPLQGYILNESIVSVHGPPWIHFEPPLKPIRNRSQLSTQLRIRIKLPKTMWIGPDPQPWLLKP